MPSPNSSVKKEAARTIKRAVIKHHARKAFFNYSGNKYANIKSGKLPTKAQAMYRRMKMFPIRVNVPLYRGMVDKTGNLFKKLRTNGEMNNSFASFSRSNYTAESFAFGMPSMTAKHIVLILPPGIYPAISRSKNFKTVGYESDEVVLAPGKYIVNKSKSNFSNRWATRSYVHVKYKPSNQLKYVPNSVYPKPSAQQYREWLPNIKLPPGWILSPEFKKSLKKYRF
jgi:hypothetical protein